ncbi:uncharacterized protein DUF4177 [Litoreibacter meonggei]|uniref:Uncharacterized protein DUF4177 n=1 Tax=Litoreibacter meonggei TaxID=1049199 RepID=A0A497X0X1_9RHOB|nr:DUF4177 domain-containing protein [Litoreibacter meonggei]RLJ59035.1 uncharacterized protein DUF4177 [Litoreibacter meonggei]
MPTFEYQVVPAPRKGKSVRKIRGNDAKFANTISVLMNEMAAEGWEYQRAETLPCEERQGLTGKTIKYHSMLVFRREIAAEVMAEDAPVVPVVAAPVVEQKITAEPEPEKRPEPVLTRTEGPASEGFLGGDNVTKPDDGKELAAE